MLFINLANLKKLKKLKSSLVLAFLSHCITFFDVLLLASTDITHSLFMLIYLGPLTIITAFSPSIHPPSIFPGSNYVCLQPSLRQANAASFCSFCARQAVESVLHS